MKQCGQRYLSRSQDMLPRDIIITTKRGLKIGLGPRISDTPRVPRSGAAEGRKTSRREILGPPEKWPRRRHKDAQCRLRHTGNKAGPRPRPHARGKMIASAACGTRLLLSIPHLAAAELGQIGSASPAAAPRTWALAIAVARLAPRLCRLTRAVLRSRRSLAASSGPTGPGRLNHGIPLPPCARAVSSSMRLHPFVGSGIPPTPSLIVLVVGRVAAVARARDQGNRPRPVCLARVWGRSRLTWSCARPRPRGRRRGG